MIFDHRAFEHPSTAMDLESMPPAPKLQVGDDDNDTGKTFDDALSRILAHRGGATSEADGGATSAAGGAASLGQESLDSCDKMYLESLDRTAMKLQ